MIPFPKEPKVLEKEVNRGVFEIEGLYPGYGSTIGNSLRRVLLSSLEGAAVTQVKIQKVGHEFATIPGVYEDVISILLNLKQLRFKLHGDEPQQATLTVKGEKGATGKDFKLPDELELANPDQHVATLTDSKAELSLEIQVEHGVGYVLAERRRKGKEDIGTMLLDAAFSPVRRVGQKVENMRVGDRTDFDRLTLDIETDGTLDPEIAFRQAAEILRDHFALVVGEGSAAVEEQKPEREPEEKKQKKAAAKKPAAKTKTAKAKKK